MYNVLIVDDDPIICTGLQKLIDWEELGYSARQYALNGLEALKLVQCNSYDLIITDIRMPKLDGIGLIQKLRELHSPSEIIVLSGYREFEYARSAMEYGVKKYLLKPVNESILINTLLEIRKEIEERDRQQLDFVKSREILREGVLLDLLKGIGTGADILERARNTGVDLETEGFRVMILANIGSTGTVKNTSSRVLKKAAEDMVSGISSTFTVMLDGERVAVLFGLQEGRETDVLRLGKQILEHASRFPGIAANLAVGRKVSGAGELPAAFQEACELLNANSHTSGLLLEPEGQASEKTITDIIRYVRENCSEKLTLQSISNRFFFNPAYMGRVFKNHTGMKFNDFLAGCRIDKAARLMENGRCKVADIARKVGYTDYDHFCKVFKMKMGCTPSEYKAHEEMKV